MDDLLTDFVAETREMLEAIEGELVTWEANPTDRARLDSIFRFVHTVKGNCGFFDFPRLERLSHAAESALSEVRVGARQADSRLVSAVLAIIDRIMLITASIETGEIVPDEGDELLIFALEPNAEAASLPLDDTVGGSKPTLSNSPVPPRSIRLPVELLDRVMSGVADMVLARNDLARKLRDSGNEPTLDGPFERLSGILTDVRDAVTRMRMRPIDYLYSAIPRLARDLAADLGKQVTVHFDGGNVELDREMIEMIRDPVMHLVRNAIDHGIEKPVDRLAAGKPETGVLSISTRQSGNKISILISDDGVGLNTAKIAEKAIAAGLLTAEDAKEMSSNAIGNLIFEAGLSTTDKVSSISGRGVGMDVVRTNIEKIGGRISIISRPDEGTFFYLRIPLTMSIISALTVSIGDQYFAIPQSYVDEIAHGQSSIVQFSRVGNADLVAIRGEQIPCLTLHNVLGVNPRNAGPDQRLVLLKLASGDRFALSVDRIHNQEDLVVKPLPPGIMQCRKYAGTTLLDNGRPVLVLDIASIAKQHSLISNNRLQIIQNSKAEEPEEKVETHTLLSFTSFDGSHHAVPLNLVLRINQAPRNAFHFEGARAYVVIDDKALPLIDPVPTNFTKQKVEILLLSNGEYELAYAVAELGGTIHYSGELNSGDTERPTAKVALINNQTVTILDEYRLFAQNSEYGEYNEHNKCDEGGIKETAPDLPICRLPDDDEWSQRIIAPLVKAAGYRIADANDTDVDVLITIADDNTIKIGSTPHSALHSINEGQSQIYRHDHAGLSDALSRVRNKIQKKRA